MKTALAVTIFTLAVLGGAGCAPQLSDRMAQVETAVTGIDKVEAEAFLARVRKAPDHLFTLLDAVGAEMAVDPQLLARVDKSKPLPSTYAPWDLVDLDGKGLSVSKTGLKLRKAAFDAFCAMSAAAKAQGVTLTVSSAYRSYAYQKALFSRNVAEMGEKEASRVSARPGSSQHQLGMAMDFGSITDAFADTKASKWLVSNASTFGFSLSYPKGMEPMTGYVWESWHYRYIGKSAAALQAEYFGGTQHYLMLFLDAFSQARPSK